MPDNILGKVVSLISGGDEPDSDKKILLRQVSKEIGQNRYGKFYRLRTDELDPSFAAYINEIYKIMYPACAFAQNTAKVNRLRELTVEVFLPKETLELVRRLRPEAVQERVKQLEPKELKRQLKEDLGNLYAVFDGNRTASINRCYNLIVALLHFARFDFLSLLRRFDTSLPEGTGGYVPRFQPAKAVDVVHELGIFRSAIQNLEPGEDWKNALAVLKIARDGQELFPFNAWNMLLTNLREVKNSNIIELMGQLAAKNPIWQAKHEIIDEQLAETWLNAKGKDVNSVVDGVLAKQRDSQIEALTVGVFGAVSITKLNFYNQEISDACIDIGLEGFAYAAPLNYLLAFIQDFIEKEMQELCDILLVRGQWINNSLSLEMSGAVHAVTDTVGPIEALDLSLSDSGTYGPRFRGALSRAERDKTQARYVNNIAEEMDDKALELINQAVQGMVVVGKHMKNLLGDSQKSPPEIVINWKELGYFTKLPFSQRLTDAYKKINYFVQLMLLQTHSEGV
ncbi:MAG: DUF5312 domain-containing protein [Treponema sp.]|jgi:hypothetical protein|nr:DUF5312 domain-containing protein [Treponema sp.]